MTRFKPSQGCVVAAALMVAVTAVTKKQYEVAEMKLRQLVELDEENLAEEFGDSLKYWQDRMENTEDEIEKQQFMKMRDFEFQNARQIIKRQFISTVESWGEIDGITNEGIKEEVKEMSDAISEKNKELPNPYIDMANTELRMSQEELHEWLSNYGSLLWEQDKNLKKSGKAFRDLNLDTSPGTLSAAYRSYRQDLDQLIEYQMFKEGAQESVDAELDEQLLRMRLSEKNLVDPEDQTTQTTLPKAKAPATLSQAKANVSRLERLLAIAEETNRKKPSKRNKKRVERLKQELKVAQAVLASLKGSENTQPPARSPIFGSQDSAKQAKSAKSKSSDSAASVAPVTLAVLGSLFAALFA